MAQQEQVPRFRAEDLLALVADLLDKAGLPGERAAIVARTLLEADLMGHSTHGLYLLPLYIDSIGDGMMTLEGEPTVLSDRGAALAWDGSRASSPSVRSRWCSGSARRGFPSGS